LIKNRASGDLQVAIEEISLAQAQNPQGDYSTWIEAVENLEDVTWQGQTLFTYSWSISNWEDIRISVTCSGNFTAETVQTED
jgi:hypothetical protein